MNRSQSIPVRRVTTHRGETLNVVLDVIGSGTMKDVYMTEDGKDVVAVYRENPTGAGLERIEAIVGPHRERVVNGPGGKDLAVLYRWPRDTVDWDGRLGLVVPTFDKAFFFEHGSANGDMLGIKGHEKNGKWFASGHHRLAFLDPRERGRWIDYLRISIRLARAVRRMHAAGLAHSDLSYRNVLVDPMTGSACIIDIDGLVVPDKYPPDVAGTPDFIAPEVVATQELPHDDPRRILPSIRTDRHALAVLIYMYLLARHPLHGRKVHDAEDPSRDDMLAMGERALWIEHPTDPSNRVDLRQVRKTALPWADTDQLPYTLTGPLLSKLFERAFVEGVHNPNARPTAEEWERALVLTADMLLPCHNPGCDAGLFVFDNTTQPACPFCTRPYPEPAPILNLYSNRGESDFRPDNHRVTVYDGLSLYRWHANRLIFPSERLNEGDRVRVAYVQRHRGTWLLVNESLPKMIDAVSGEPIPRGENVALADGAQILLERGDGGRLIQVQMTSGT